MKPLIVKPHNLLSLIGDKEANMENKQMSQDTILMLDNIAKEARDLIRMRLNEATGHLFNVSHYATCEPRANKASIEFAISIKS